MSKSNKGTAEASLLQERHSLSSSSPWCFAEHFLPYAPSEEGLTESACLRMARQEAFPPYLRYCGQRSRAFFRRSDILDYFRYRWGKSHPECVEALIRAGFQEEPGKKGKKNDRIE